MPNTFNLYCSACNIHNQCTIFDGNIMNFLWICTTCNMPNRTQMITSSEIFSQQNDSYIPVVPQANTKKDGKVTLTLFKIQELIDENKENLKDQSYIDICNGLNAIFKKL